MPLLHLGTDIVGGRNNLCWGDAGNAGWFIDPKALAKQDFSKVLYHSDD